MGPNKSLFLAAQGYPQREGARVVDPMTPCDTNKRGKRGRCVNGPERDRDNESRHSLINEKREGLEIAQFVSDEQTALTRLFHVTMYSVLQIIGVKACR